MKLFTNLVKPPISNHPLIRVTNAWSHNFQRRKPFENFYEIFSWVLRPDGNFGPLKRTRNSTYPGVTKTYKPPPLLLGIFTFRLYLNFRFSSSNFEPNKMKMHSRSVIIIYCTFSAFSLLNKIVFWMGLIFTIRWRRVMGPLQFLLIRGLISHYNTCNHYNWVIRI